MLVVGVLVVVVLVVAGASVSPATSAARNAGRRRNLRGGPGCGTDRLYRRLDPPGPAREPIAAR
jgi:hypothetical protein